MQLNLLISIFIAAVILGLALVLVLRRSLTNRDLTIADRHPQGYWMGVGMGIGIALGVALGTAFENIAIGIAIGVAIGAGIGASLEQKYKDNLRPPTDQERSRQRWGLAVGVSMLLVLAGILIALLWLNTR
jgi:hypothetical protein